MRRQAYRSRDSFAQVTWEMVEECGGDVVLAAVFDWIAWKCDARYDGVEHDGITWYPVSVKGLSATTHISEKVIRRALEQLVAQRHLESIELGLGGVYDRTKSYRPLWDEDEGTSSRPTGQVEDSGLARIDQLDSPHGADELPARANVPIRKSFNPPTPAQRGSVLPHPNILAALEGKPLAVDETRVCTRHKRQRSTCLECWTLRPLTFRDIPWCGECMEDTRQEFIDPSGRSTAVRRCPRCNPRGMTPEALEEHVTRAFGHEASRTGQGKDFAIPRGDR